MKKLDTFITGFNMKPMLAGLVFLCLFGVGNRASALIIEVTADDIWSNLSPTPTNADTVKVKYGANLTVDVPNAKCNVLILGEGDPSGGDGKITFNASSRLDVIGANGQVQIGNSGYKSTIEMTNGGTLSFMDMTLGAGSQVLIPGSGTIISKPVGTVTLPTGFDIFNHIVQDSTGSTVFGAAVTINGNVTVSQGTLSTDNANNWDMTISGSLSISGTGNFDANNSNISLSRNLTNTGTFTYDSSKITLDSSRQSITGTTTFYNLFINSAGDIPLNSDITVVNQLDMSGDDLILGAHDLIIGTGGSVTNAGSSNYIQVDGGGVMRKNFNATGGFAFPIGDNDEYSPVVVTLNAGTTFGGGDYVSFKVTDAKHPSVGSGSHITRYWTANSGGFTAIDYTYKAIYLDADIYGVEGDMLLGRWDGSSWSNYDLVNTVTNEVFNSSGISVIPSNHDFTGGAPGVLPIELLSFEAKSVGGSVMLSWATAIEINNDFFTVERSRNGLRFEEATTVMGAGNSSSTNSYNFLDDHAYSGVTYYRLMQTDYDGNSKFTKPIAVKTEIPSSNGFIKAYPNPASSSQPINLELLGFDGGKELLVALIDQYGREVFSKVIFEERAGNRIVTAIDVQQKLTPGIYFVIGSNDNNSIYKQKLVITSYNNDYSLVKR